MPGAAVALGPFKGGLNTLNDASAISDDELSDIVNFEIDVDGSLHGRPPIVDDPAGVPSITSRLLYLGCYVTSLATFRLGSSLTNTVKYVGGAWSQLRATTTSTAACQYANKVYVVSNNASGPGFSFDGTTVADVATMPKGDCAVIWKERLWIGAGISQGALLSTKLNYSQPGDPTAWGTLTTSATAGSFDVGQGDGEPITGLLVYNDNLIVFKTDSTWVVSYDTDPRIPTVRKISPNIGASSLFCVAQRQSEVYVNHEGEIFEFVNYNYTKINIQCPFTFDAAVPVGNTGVENTFISVMGDRLVCRFWNRVYVYSFISRAWTRWTTTKYFGPLVRDPADISANGVIIYYAGSYVTPTVAAYRIKDGWTTSDSETMTCSIATKIYSIAEQSKFKRLFWWGADLIAQAVVTSQAVPITTSLQSYWSALDLTTWGTITGNTWANPLNTTTAVTSTVDISGFAIGRRFIKFQKSLRFREIQFTLSVPSDGKNPTARLFSLNLYVAAKEKVVALVS